MRLPPRAWKIASWVLLFGWVIGAGLNMAHVHGGFLTNYLADTAFPPWFYLRLRGLDREDGRGMAVWLVGDWFGRSPVRAACSIFAVGVASELKTKFWPRGIITGTYDPMDIAAYAAGLAIVFALDRPAAK